MGYDAYAYAIVGLKVDPKKLDSVLHKEDLVRGCSHEVDSIRTKFCPECGKPVVKSTTVPHPEFDVDDSKFFGFKLLCKNSEDRNFYYIAGEVASSSSYSGKPYLNYKNIEDIKGKMKNVLEPLGLWKESSFGIHVFLYESC